MLDKDQIKESLTNDDIVTVLLELGSEHHHLDNQGRPKFVTVCHGGSGYNLQYYPNDHTFRCFSECANNKDIFQLVMEAKSTQGYEVSFPEAVKFVAELTGKSFTTSYTKEMTTNRVDDWEWINKVTRRKPRFNQELPVYDESVLDVFLPYTNDWVNEGITKDVADIFEVGFHLPSDGITLPHRDKNGRLIGIRQRNTRQEDLDSGRKYIPTVCAGLQYTHIVSHNLYGLHITKEAIKKSKRVYLFEGEKSVMKAQKYYGENNFSVGVSGSNISNWQVETLLSLGVEHVVIAFDRFRAPKEDESDLVYERAVIAYQDRLLRLARKFTPFTRTYIIWDYDGALDYSDSPIDRGKELFELLTENKIEIATKGE